MELLEIASAFRAAAETLKLQINKPAIMVEFPRGCCGDFTVVLGAFLCARGLTAMVVEADEKGVTHGDNHAWLEVSGLVVDITGDQFPGRPPVYVAPADDWYKMFWDVEEGEKSSRPADTTLSADQKALLERLLAIMEEPEDRP